MSAATTTAIQRFRMGWSFLLLLRPFVTMAATTWLSTRCKNLPPCCATLRARHLIADVAACNSLTFMWALLRPGHAMLTTTRHFHTNGSRLVLGQPRGR